MVALSAAARTHAGRNRLSMIGFLPRPTEVQGRVLRVLFPPQGGAFWLGLAVRGACCVQASQFGRKAA